MLDRSSNFEAEQPVPSRNGLSMEPGHLVSSLVARVRSLGWVFALTVLVPTLCGILYYGFLASDVYISESRFIVRSPEKPVASGLGVLLRTAGFSNGGTEAYAARDYVMSRDALDLLNHDDAFRQAYGASHVSVFDRFNPLGLDGSDEALYKFYQKQVSIGHDNSSSISTLRVKAFTPEDAQKFNAVLLGRAEELVNRLNTRAQQDMIALADKEVQIARDKAANTAALLASFRNKQRIVDPEKEAEVQLQMVSKLQDELIATRMQISQLRSLAPNSTQLPVLTDRVQSLTREIESERGKITGTSGSLANNAVRYQRLLLDNEFAEKQLASAMASYEEARNEATRKQAYVERIVEPNRPDDAVEPRRLRGMFTVFVLGLIAWGMVSMLLAGVREHRD